MLRRILDRVHPLFATGGRLEKLFPLYEAADTFLYTPSDVTRTASHVRDGMDLKRLMSLVVVALGPCFYMALHNTGYQANLAIAEESASPVPGWREDVFAALGRTHDPNNLIDNLLLGALYFVPVYVVTVAAGGLWELLFASVRGHEINEGFLVTSALFPLTLPPTIPLWQVAIGISFGVVVGKEIFGGTGKNFLNPALTARAFLYFAYPGFIAGVSLPAPAPPAVDPHTGIWVAADGISSPTVLGALADANALPIVPEVSALTGLDWWDYFLGWIPGSMGETSTAACLLGAAVLIGLGVGSWKIMAGCVLGLLGMSAVLMGGVRLSGGSENALLYLAPHWQLVVGGFAFGAVFMATDPVSAAMTDAGRWWYGILIGVMTVLIRALNPAYPEGIMLAILFGNVMAPLIDYFVIQANIKRRQARYAT